jgi:casein kinase 1
MDNETLLDSGDVYESEEVDPPPPPPIPNMIANWWLNEKLGSGYSGIAARLSS